MINNEHMELLQQHNLKIIVAAFDKHDKTDKTDM
jgi:hypothetical protein